MSSVSFEYLLFIAAASTGAIQVGASLGGLRGILLLRSPIASSILGLVLVAAAFVVFYAVGDRNVNDHEGGMDANGQAIYFSLGSLVGLAITLAVSSIVNAGMRRGASPTAGLAALTGASYARAAWRSISYWWREWRTQTKPYFFG